MQTKELSLHHIIRPSETSGKKTPALFMFHGYGSNEEDLFSFASELPGELCIISVQAPYSLPPYGYAWYAIHFDSSAQPGTDSGNNKWSDDEQAIASREKIAAFIDEAITAYDLDTDNITLLGFSQGTILSYALALSYPEKVKNIIALSGYINENILAENYAEKDHTHLSFYCSHGSADQVIPVDWARQAPPLLKKLGIEHTYEEFPVGHGVAPQNFYSFHRWLTERLAG
ncbi:alpha/beta hydrolase [Sinomicrobium weinanense]|uniref:Alpha/beta fold hydrolase n=1 Tax=Sinomicrobium weinanense TaxID=2842200 RepID=A0A926JP64_9FLAO|nr:alpha/beta fold hydrolase [Sinomicrobium weinanense]MBC9794727.1 alpha/beta fold hydrolase [Sinomicrobium weinanense]MBU3124986.1 alpha/beta fold hydrolase [Sinomicrobium weinanense]